MYVSYNDMKVVHYGERMVLTLVSEVPVDSKRLPWESWVEQEEEEKAIGYHEYNVHEDRLYVHTWIACTCTAG